MYIAHSALRHPQKKQSDKQQTELKQRLQAYHAACQKHQQEIVAIQRYLPGWMPAFEMKG